MFIGSSLGAYDGQAYERLLDFAKKSKFNDKDVHDVYHKYLKPFANQVKAKLWICFKKKKTY